VEVVLQQLLELRFERRIGRVPRNRRAPATDRHRADVGGAELSICGCFHAADPRKVAADAATSIYGELMAETKIVSAKETVLLEFVCCLVDDVAPQAKG